MRELSPDEKHAIWKKGVEYGEDHTKPSPETRERLKALEVNQTNYMEQNTKEHTEIKDLIMEIKKDLKDAVEKKADESDVHDIESDVEDLKTWKWKIVGVIAVLIFAIPFIKDYIILLIKK